MRRRSCAHGCVAIASLHVGDTVCIAPAHLVAVLGALCTSSWSLPPGRYRRFSSGNGRYGTASSRSETSLNDKTSAKADVRASKLICPLIGTQRSFANGGRRMIATHFNERVLSTPMPTLPGQFLSTASNSICDVRQDDRHLKHR